MEKLLKALELVRQQGIMTLNKNLTSMLPAITVLLEDGIKETTELLEAVATSCGIAHCYDRYCHDDEWTYCIFCNQGDHDPHTKQGWIHSPDCLTVKIQTLLDTRKKREG